MSEMRTGVRLGIDVGKARIGVARCDPHAMLATPVETVARALTDDADISRILEIARELDAFELVVGLPLGLAGHHTASTEDARSFAAHLSSAAATDNISVRLVDERLSTVSAQGHLRAAGKKTKQSKNIIDQAAAVVILQHALDMERARSIAPGTVVTPTLQSPDSQPATSTENEHT